MSGALSKFNQIITQSHDVSEHQRKIEKLLKNDNQHHTVPYALFLFYLPYLSSIHEKANCIAILWTGSPHSLGNCLFRGLWATCLPHKGGASR